MADDHQAEQQGGREVEVEGRNWRHILTEIQQLGSTHDVVRRRYLQEIREHTGRNVIAYYTGFLQKAQLVEVGARFHIHDGDLTGFMSAIHGMETSHGLDLLLHTPGGDVAAVEGLVTYLRDKFDDIRAIVPQLAMSGGTMIAMAARSIVMGKHSSIGPIDPQFGPMPAHLIVKEFEQAKQEIGSNPALANYWAPLLQKYSPTLYDQAKNAITWADEMAEEWLRTGMLEGDPDVDAKIERIATAFGSPERSKNHARHISAVQAGKAGLTIEDLEADQGLQDAVLAAHHAYTLTFAHQPVIKIIENHMGVAMVETFQEAR